MISILQENYYCRVEIKNFVKLVFLVYQVKFLFISLYVFTISDSDSALLWNTIQAFSHGPFSLFAISSINDKTNTEFLKSSLVAPRCRYFKILEKNVL